MNTWLWYVLAKFYFSELSTASFRQVLHTGQVMPTVIGEVSIMAVPDNSVSRSKESAKEIA